MNINIDDDKIKAAARVMFDKDNSYGEADEKPGLDVYETAMLKFIEKAAEKIMAEPDYYAFGPKMIFWGEWNRAQGSAEYMHREKA